MSVAPLTLPDRVAGSLLGLALGDALGFVVEAAPCALAEAYVRSELGPRTVGTRAHHDFPFGQYSDDTQLARVLLRSVRDAGRWEPTEFAAGVAELFRIGKPVGAGPGTHGAAARLIAGARWAEAGAPAPYAGNGGAMRVAPLGVLLAHDPERLVSVAAEQCRVTHLDSRCVGGAVAVAVAAGLIAQPGPIDRARVLRKVARVVAGVDAEMADVVHALGDWLDLPPDSAKERLREARLDPGEVGAWRGISSHVVPSVAWSLYAALRTPDDYWTAVCTAIEVGGDTDTMAAMTGGIVGGRVGRPALPGALLDRLTDRGQWRADALEALARDCARRDLFPPF
jgi:ADP-ribosylglycohydrolase